MVDLSILPHEQTHLVVIGTSLRKSKAILAAYLQSLAWQVKPRNVQFLYLFVDDGLDPEAKTLVEAFVAEHGGQLIPSGQGGAPDWTDSHPVTHQWTDTAMARVGRNKDWIINSARENRAEALWFVDSDLICDPMTFSSLWSIPEQIVCGVYWTKWQKTAPEQNPVHAGPQVWMRHPYSLDGGGLEEWELRRKLIDRGIVQVFGQGACTLIRKDALLKGVSFAPVPGNVGPGLMQGEDRQFCIRAEMMHIRMVADGWPDLFHIYHRPEDEALIPEMLTRLGRAPVTHISTGPEMVATYIPSDMPEIGGLVSLELAALEPVPTQQGLMYAPAQLVRGRLGKLALHPELENAVLEMERGEARVVPVHFGLDYPFAPHRGQRKLIRVTLIDHKPHGFQPVIESEIIRNEVGGWIDTTTQTPSNLTLMREVHAA